MGTSIKRYQNDEIIIHQGDSDRVLYRVLSGNVELYINYGQPGEYLVGSVAPSHYFGEIMLLGGYPSRYTAVVQGEAAVLHIPEDAFEDYIKHDHRNALSIMRTTARNAYFLYSLVHEIGENHRMDVILALNRMMAKREKVEADELASRKALLAKRRSELAMRQAELAEQREKAIGSREPEAGGLPAPELPLPLVEGNIRPEDLYDQAPLPGQEDVFLSTEANDDAGPEDKEAFEEMESAGLYLLEHRSSSVITHPGYREYLFEKSYTCPHCRRTFTSARPFYAHPGLVATEHPEASRYEFRIFYRDFEAEWYDVVTCPHCYFSALDGSYSGEKMLYATRYEQKLVEARAIVWLDFEEERNIDFVLGQHYLALICAPAFSNYRQVIAHLWMNLKWICKNAGEEQLAQISEEQALRAYKSVYSECFLTPEQEQQVCMQVANMLLQSGDTRGAREWAAKVRMNRMGKSVYASLMEQLIEDAREVEALKRS